MTHLQNIFIKNLRFYRNKRGISQLKFSEMIDISPNYLNAVENGKNFPSVEVLQSISDILDILPYQLFLEYPIEFSEASLGSDALIQELIHIKQRFILEIDQIIEKYQK